MARKIKLSKSDMIASCAVKIMEKIEATDGRILGSALIVAGIGAFLISTEASKSASVKFINSVYEKFRKTYNIPEETFISIKPTHIEILEL